MRILIIEDNKEIADALKRGLKDNYAVDLAYNGKDGLKMAEETAYDVILLDLNLPILSGEEVCSQLRQKNITVPILILTGRTMTEDKVNLLDMGADDYITKPFDIDEIKARIRAALRRSSHERVPILKVADLELDPAGRTATRAGINITLRRKEFDLLEYLMRNQGRTLTRAMILEHIWDMNENLWANVIDVHIKHLRDKVDRPFKTSLIKTVHGVGYKLEDTSSKKAVAKT